MTCVAILGLDICDPQESHVCQHGIMFWPIQDQACRAHRTEQPGVGYIGCT